MARKKTKNLLWFLIVILLFLGSFFVLNLSIFEKNAPQILVENTLYTNLKSPLLVKVKDEESAVKSIKIVLKKDNNDTGIILADSKIKQDKEVSLQINLPKQAYKEKTDSYILEIWAKDTSFWNFNGNEAHKQVVIKIDNEAPKLNIISNSYHIEQGGAASVVFKAEDTNLKELFIETNKGRIFKVTPYLKKDYYAALIAWDARDEEFRAYVIAKDAAGNIAKERIRYYLLNRKYRVSNINLSDKFLDGKIESLASIYAPKNNTFTRFEKFKFVNETLRLSNEELIHKITSAVPEESFGEFNINLFLPLKNAAKVADFADHRYYSYNGQFVSDSYHMGLDLASTSEAPIISNNVGKVVFAEENGIYGLNLILYHGFGIYTLYGHCSSSNVELNENVAKNSIIAKTGVSGLALGDHLHFGVLVQGVETRPEQWQDKKWLENNIYKVFNDAKKVIVETR
ncbi:M23 family metallopeptidase [Campylobacter vulpis]|uniref:M23 family metallopeptidase n=1 Tax=Campylobacter vulpis TaxID=1655500 RepID=A0ABS5P3F0_9BACT|nr:M23 family metallopeptidase [Campylobacter vulpis]MBS4235757.1 M23 family metallopeptidase [Campylobacter vulpis]MBS4241231.1 M23 family metallopeptidase [Campylobacter vulpis]MBS4252705.1 M23 family metallopeptidase [Campylobacter vulpis]MBS4269391.1 M23 family metallopeptidase [Campylobacter vulpis]MBS4275426.1 M23 family metallopeptidase [Campylobacter vulpis]